MVPVNFDFFHSKNSQSDTYRAPASHIRSFVLTVRVSDVLHYKYLFREVLVTISSFWFVWSKFFKIWHFMDPVFRLLFKTYWNKVAADFLLSCLNLCICRLNIVLKTSSVLVMYSYCQNVWLWPHKIHILNCEQPLLSTGHCFEFLK